MMTQFQQRDRILPVLTSPEVYQQKQVGYRCFVELVAKVCELQDDRAVPVSTQTIDVVVTQPAESALAKLNEVIAQLIATCEWLKDYSVVSYSKLSFDEAPF